MDKTRWRRCTLVLPRTVHQDLRYLSEVTGLTQSALVRDMLGDTVPALADIVREATATGDLKTLEKHMADLVARAESQYKAMQGATDETDH